MKYFVTADIHGYFNEFKEALDEKGFDYNNKNHKLIICGDLFDRGGQPRELLDFVLKHKDKIILIRGNHEDLLEEMAERNQAMMYDITNGTAYTIIDLYPEWEVTEFDLKKILKETRLEEVLSLCQNYYETDNYIFVHAWIPVKETSNKYDANWRRVSEKRWANSRWLNPVEMFKNKVFEPNKKIVFGHWHCSAFWHLTDPAHYDEFGDNENFEPFGTENILALDACTFNSGKVNVVVIED